MWILRTVNFICLCLKILFFFFFIIYIFTSIKFNSLTIPELLLLVIHRIRSKSFCLMNLNCLWFIKFLIIKIIHMVFSLGESALLVLLKICRLISKRIFLLLPHWNIWLIIWLFSNILNSRLTNLRNALFLLHLWNLLETWLHNLRRLLLYCWMLKKTLFLVYSTVMYKIFILIKTHQIIRVCVLL